MEFPITRPMKITELTLLALQTAFMRNDPTTQAMCAAVEGELRDTAVNAYGLLMYQALAPTVDSPFYDKNKDKGFAFKLEDTPFGNALLDELAWQFHVDFYDKTLDFHRRKEIVRQAIKIHRIKGTPQAVLDLLKTSFPSDTQLLEWFTYGGEPYHFKIITSTLNNVNMGSFLRALNSVKNARSYLDGVQLYESIDSAIYSKFENKRDVSYTMFVGTFGSYTFGDGEAFAFGYTEREYSVFVEDNTLNNEV